MSSLAVESCMSAMGTIVILPITALFYFPQPAPPPYPSSRPYSAASTSSPVFVFVTEKNTTNYEKRLMSGKPQAFSS